MDWVDEDFEVTPKTHIQIFEETFLGYFELFKLRVNHLEELQKGSLDYKTYFDMALVQLRALCIESPTLKNNYTLQTYLAVHGFTDKAKEVDQFFAQNIGGSITLREAIKVTADKFIAHYDTVIKNNPDEGDYDVKSTFYRFMCEKDLSRTNSGIGLKNILDFMEMMVSIVKVPAEVTSNSIAWSTWL